MRLAGALALARLATRARREGCSRLELAMDLAAPFLEPVRQMALLGVIWRQVRRAAPRPLTPLDAGTTL